MALINEEHLTDIISAPGGQTAEDHATRLHVPLGKLLQRLEEDPRFLVTRKDGKQRKDSTIDPLVQGEDHDLRDSDTDSDLLSGDDEAVLEDGESDTQDMGDEGGEEDSEPELFDMPDMATSWEAEEGSGEEDY